MLRILLVLGLVGLAVIIFVIVLAWKRARA